MSITVNLLKHWNAATPTARREGRNWYCNARAVVGTMARDFSTTPAIAAGVVAATSPRMYWSRNVAVSRALLAGHEVTGVFGASLDKARRIIAGAKPSAVLGGNKVRAFYRALLGDRTAAVIDTWMVKAAGLLPRVSLTDEVYRKVVAALETLAGRLHIAVAELQAVIWVAIRGRAA